MAFEPGKWADGQAGGTPVTADELNRIEQAGAQAASAAGSVPEHGHDAGDITSGTLATARIPTLAQGKITGLSAALDGKADASALADLVTRIEALETPEA